MERPPSPSFASAAVAAPGVLARWAVSPESHASTAQLPARVQADPAMKSKIDLEKRVMVEDEKRR